MCLSSAQLAELILLLLANRAESEKFSRYILTAFEPLLSQPDPLNHEIWDGHTLGIRADADGEPVVAIKRDIIDGLLEGFASQDVEAQRELLLQLTKPSNEEAHGGCELASQI